MGLLRAARPSCLPWVPHPHALLSGGQKPLPGWAPPTQVMVRKRDRKAGGHPGVHLGPGLPARLLKDLGAKGPVGVLKANRRRDQMCVAGGRGA